MPTTRWLKVLVALAVFGAATVAWTQVEMMPAGLFSALKPGAALPEPWKPLGVSGAKNPTRYTVVDDGGITVLRADSSAAASGLSRAVSVNPADFPTLKWRWKISNILKNSDIRTREGDDYPVRVYVMFDYPLQKMSFTQRTKIRLARALHDPHLPTATLCYVWDGKAPAGTIVISSYTDLVRMVVVESGASRVSQWLTVERNVASDFKAAFGEEAPRITGIAIATDTDNTGESVVAHYGDISFYKHKVTK